MWNVSTSGMSRPNLAIEPGGLEPAGQNGLWHTRWRLENRSDRALSVLSARLPHDRFYAEEHALDPPLDLEPGQGRELRLTVQCDEAQGAEFENAFLILRVLHGQDRWQVLARLKIVVGNGGVPVPIQERISTQPVGFAR